MTPDTLEWLNAEFVQKILREYEKDDSIVVTDVTSKPATAKGDNYTSEMTRATIQYSHNKNGRTITEKKSLIVKVSPTMEGAHKDMIEKVGLFTTEMRMMATTLKEMEEMVSVDGYRLGARVLYTETGSPTLLIIEDLAPLGFRMADREAGLDLKHCLLAMRGLAKFHASSVALCEKEPKHKEFYKKSMFNRDHPDEMKQFFTDGMKTLAKETKNWTELGPGYEPKLTRLSEVCYGKAADRVVRKDDDFNVINHGDFWVNNMLFRYNDEGQVTDHIFVDFQLCVYTSPAVDLLYFLNTSPSDEVDINHRDSLLKEYLDTLVQTMSSLGCKTKPPSMATLKKALEEREFYGVLSACSILPLVRVERGDVRSLDEILQGGDSYENPAYKGASYRKTMLRRLPDWNARGLLDV